MVGGVRVASVVALGICSGWGPVRLRSSVRSSDRLIAIQKAEFTVRADRIARVRERGLAVVGARLALG